MTKKLMWYNYELMYMHQPAYNYYLDQKVQPKPNIDALKWHLAMSNMTQHGRVFVDQSRLSESYGDGMDMARVIPDVKNIPKVFNADNGAIVDKNFDAAAYNRVDDLFDHAEKHNLTDIRISWSGGIDSNFILSAMMMHPRTQRWLDNRCISIYTTRYGKREDPAIWDWIMNSGMPVHFLDYNKLFYDTGPWLMVTGDGESYGTVFYRLHKSFVDKDKILYAHWSTMEDFFLDKDRDPSGLAWDYFKALMEKSPVPVETCYHAWWWFEANVAEQDFMFRPHAYSSAKDIDADHVFYCQKHFFGFLSSQDLADHGFYSVVTRKMPEDRHDLMKVRLQENVAKWQGWSEIRPKQKFYSQGLIPKRVYKSRIYDDWSWDDATDFSEMYK